VSHELRTPITIIKGAMDNLKDGVHGPITQDQQEPLTIVERELKRLSRVVGDMLDLGHIESGKFRLKSRALVLQEIIRETTEMCRGLAVSRGLRVEMELAEPAAWIFGDRDRLVQILVNLQTNSIKFTDKGWIRIQLCRNGDLFQILVSDSGPGIPKEALGSIFNKFERIGDGNREGSGLGLPIAKALAELHGGRLWVESELGKGSCFILQLPAMKKNGMAASEAVGTETRTGREAG